MYINSPGGVITAGLAIYDTMQVGAPRACWQPDDLLLSLKAPLRV